jgi:protein transport protein SEC24
MSHVGGKMVVCTTTMPNVGSARLKNRDNAAAYGTDREHTLRNPEDPFWCGGPSPHLTHTHIYSGR